MDTYCFDTVIDRRASHSIKFNFAAEHGLPEDVLPLWLADMDFQVPPAVTKALQTVVEHGIFGYSDVKEDYYHAVSAWFLRRFGWQTRPEWLVRTPGVVFALAMAVRALTQPGDRVLVQPPVYYPFFRVVRDNDRELVENPLIYRDGRYTIDFADFEQKIAEQQVKLFILCSPHNPIGRVWTRGELQRMGEICHRHKVFVLSDEIHCDFAFAEHPHTVFPLACPQMAEQTIVCTAPSKTFNLAGLQTSNIWIPGEEARAAFAAEIRRCASFGLNVMGLTACQAAYEGGEDWLDACRTYLRGNLDFVRDYLAEHLPQIKLVEPEGTYFAWLDCSALGLSCEELNDRIIHKAKLWLDAGQIFDDCAAQFQRMVLACPRATLEQAMTQLKQGLG